MINKKRMVLLLITVLLVSVVLYMNTPKFGRIPRGERLARIENSPNYKNGKFHNLEYKPQMTGEGSRFDMFWRMFAKTNPKLKPTDAMEVIKTDLHGLPLDKDY